MTADTALHRSPDQPTASALQADDATRVSMLETLLTIRAYEEQLAALASPSAPGTCTSVGQEAAAVGVVRALAAHDRILSNHRSAGHLIARGADPGRLMAEVMGRVDGYCKGKSGSLHISAAELGVVLTSTIVGGELSLAPGVALALKLGAVPGDAPSATNARLTTVTIAGGTSRANAYHRRCTRQLNMPRSQSLTERPRSQVTVSPAAAGPQTPTKIAT